MRAGEVTKLARWPSGLSQAHRKHLEESGITAEVAVERGYFSTTDRALMRQWGFAPSQIPKSGTVLVLPIQNVHHEIGGYVLKPDEPRPDKHGKVDEDGKVKVLKYEFAAGFRMMLDVPKRFQTALGNPGVPLVVTEGQKKADSAASQEFQEFCCVDLLGVWNWRGKNEHGGKVALADWEKIALNDGRLVYIVFDSDIMTKLGVYQALIRLKLFLESRGAKAKVIYLPANGDKKVGLDDYLVAGHTIEEVFALATDKLVPVHEGRQVGQYIEHEDGIHLITQEGTTVRLTNYTARILVDMRRDDGTETETKVREYEVGATVNARPVEVFRVGASKFDQLAWVGDNLGADAVIEVIGRAREHIAAAIHKFSDGHEKRHVYTHTGWRKINGKEVYLHGGGGIDHMGLRKDVTVEIGREYPALRPFVLLAPLAGPDLIDVIHVELQFLELGPLIVTAPVWSAIWRSVIDRVDFSLHIDGETGTFKTELATLAQQHFGVGFHSRALPASWHSTSNLNESLAFILKDAVDVVDDFKPVGSATDRQRMHADADKLLRAAGNAAGRGKLNSDSSLRPARPPRGMIISTGEETPGGGSLGARLWVTEVQKGMIDKAKLTTCQSMALNGFYTQCMSSFLSWLASRRAAVLSEMRTRLPDLRKKADLSGHPRTPGVVGDLYFGAEMFFRFASEVGAVATEVEDHLGGIWNAMLEVSKTRNSQIREQESSRRFLELFISAITAGKAHLIRDVAWTREQGGGSRPLDAERWGWTENPPGMWNPKGEGVGWVDDDNVYLDSAAAYKAAQGMTSGLNGIVVEEKTWRKRLADDKLLASTGYEVNRKTPIVQVTLQGQRRDVLHLKKSAFESEVAEEVK